MTDDELTAMQKNRKDTEGLEKVMVTVQNGHQQALNKKKQWTKITKCWEKDIGEIKERLHILELDAQLKGWEVVDHD